MKLCELETFELELSPRCVLFVLAILLLEKELNFIVSSVFESTGSTRRFIFLVPLGLFKGLGTPA